MRRDILSLRNKLATIPVGSGIQTLQRAQNFREGIAKAFEEIQSLNIEINAVRPWEFLKNGNSEDLDKHLPKWIEQIRQIRAWLYPIIPTAAENIDFALAQPQETVPQLFPRR